MNNAERSPSRRRVRLGVAVALLTILSFASYHLISPRAVQGISTTVVISQIQVAGGTSADEFVELHNVSNSNVDLNGLRVVYRSAAGTTDVAIANWTTSTIIPPGGYYLIAATPGYDGAVAADRTFADGGSGRFAAAGGGMAIRNGALDTGTIIDSVGYGTATNAFVEGTATAAPASNASRARNTSGCQDSDNNSNDFALVNPSTPRNHDSTASICGGGGSTNPSGVGAANPSTVAAGSATLLTVAVTPGTNPASTGLAVTADLTAIGGSAMQTFFDDGTNGDVTGGDNIFSFNATVAANTSGGSKSLPFTITDAQSRSGSGSISLTVTTGGPGNTRIHDIQGASHTSPLVGQSVSNVPGIVTALAANGFYLQDPTPDANDATSEGVFVFTSSAPSRAIGDSVLVSGTVQEFRPGGASSTNLTITEIGSPTVSVVSTGNALPAAVVIGTGGRVPPTEAIEDDAAGNVETSGVFDPATDGIDFYESLEGMRVQINNAVAVSPTIVFGTTTQNREIAVIADNGANVTGRTTRGGIVVTASDFNPERVILNDILTGAPVLPSVNVNDSFPGAIVGVMDYTFGNFKLQVQSVPSLVAGGLALETTTTAGTNQMAIATFNCENLDPSDGAAKFNSLADIIVNRLKSPDLVTLEEIQDNNGATDDGTVDPSTTMSMLMSAIQTAGGPTYQYRQINPVNDQDGGEPGGNIRQVFMFRTDRGLSFIDRAGGTSTAATTVVNSGGPQLSFSPGRIDPTNTAWNASRKPLAGEFMYNGQHLFVIGNHFNSKGGDQPLYGRFQPPTLSSETQRLQQAQIVHDFVNSILAVDSNADVVVLGDLNDFEFSNPLVTLKGSGAGTILHALIETLPPAERYSYVFEGNSQTLDHILISNNLFNNIPFVFDVVHVNSEFAVQASDHDPSVVRFTVAPTAVKLESFTATAQGSETLLRWQTGEEADNLGFNVYREEAGERRRVTPQIVAGSALVAGPGTTLGAGRSYSWWDGQARAGARYWLEAIDLDGNSRWYGPVTMSASGGKKPSAVADRQAVMLNALGREEIQPTASRPVEVTAGEVQLAAKRPASVNLGAQAAVKIAVNREGWYRLTQAELVRAGLDPKVNPRMLQLYADGRELPLMVTGKGGAEFTATDAIEFYGVGLDTASTDTHVYWLVAGRQPGLRVEQVKGAGLKTAAASFAYTVERRDRTIYFAALRNGDRENFFGPVITRTPVNQAVTVQHLAAPSAEQAVIAVTLQGVTSSPHKVGILLNGAAIGTAVFNAQESYTATVNVAAGSLKEGENVISLAAQGSDADISLIDTVRVTYPHSFTADDNALRLSVGSKQSVTIDGFTSNAIRVFDVTDANAPQEIVGAVKSQKNSYAVTVTVTATGGGARRLMATTADQLLRPASVTANQPSAWRAASQSADLVIITHGSLTATARQLQAYRESRGLRVALVDVEDVYDEFSFGNKSAYALRDFLAYAKENWQRAPQFVLLMGDATYDPRNYLGRGDFDLVPTKLVDTQTMETASDDWLVDFAGKGFAEMAVGRLPVRSADEAARMIAKVIGYESAAGSDSALIISDNSDSFDFEGAGAELRGLLPDTIKAEQIDRGELGTAAAKQALFDRLQRGQRIVNYIGHGSADTWRDGLLTSAEARGLTNGDRLPLFVAMTCLNGYFQDASVESLAESLMKAERGGAIAVWASSGMTLPGAQSRMNQQLYRLIFDADRTQGKSLGDVTLRAKSSISDADVRRTWILFGDPTTILR